jgi:hypothetical protein
VLRIERLSLEDQGLHEVWTVGAHPPILFDESVGVLMAAKHLYGLRFRHGGWDFLLDPARPVVPAHSYCHEVSSPLRKGAYTIPSLGVQRAFGRR